MFMPSLWPLGYLGYSLQNSCNRKIYKEVRLSYFMKITKLSTKGQIVIPEELRKNLDVGTPFVISIKDDLIILKKIGGLTNEEMKEMNELNKIWKEIDKRVYGKVGFGKVWCGKVM